MYNLKKIFKLTYIYTKNINIYLIYKKKKRKFTIFFKNNKNKIYFNLFFNDFLFSNYFFIFYKKIFFKSFLGLLYSYICQIKIGFFLEIITKGIGYNIYKKKKFLFFELGYSHYIGLKIPKNLLIKRFKARISIFGFSKQLVHNFVIKLLLLKKVDIYKGKGVIYRNQKIILKEGKKR